MTETDKIIWRTLDRGAEVDISYQQLPHWDQTGALMFVTFRMADSLPRSVIERWVRSETQFEYFQRYIEENPKKANLTEGEFLFWKRA